MLEQHRKTFADYEVKVISKAIIALLKLFRKCSMEINSIGSRSQKSRLIIKVIFNTDHGIRRL